MYSKKILLFVLIVFMCVSGCAKSKEPASAEDKVIAKINDYKLTVADFNDGLKTTMAQRFLAADPENAKKDILEELILRNILIQEAQKENFDKERSFMRQIEKYWEQALVKSLLKKKLQEVSGMIHADKKEITDEYNKMKGGLSAGEQAGFPALETMEGEIRNNILKRKKEAIIEKWVDGLRKKASVSIYPEALNEVEAK